MDDIIEAVGGTGKAAELAGVVPSAVSNWRADGKIPAKYSWLFEEQLGDLPDDCFGWWGQHMRSPYESRIALGSLSLNPTISISRQSRFGTAWKSLFPIKPAEELAARVGCAIRTAAYEISGKRHPSAQSILALVMEVTPNWK